MSPVYLWLPCVMLAACVSVGSAKPRAAELVRVGSTCVSLGFDARTGAWVSLVDRETGQELATGSQPLVPSLQTLRPDSKAVARTVDAGRAISLEGEWRFTPSPGPDAESSCVRGQFGRGDWKATLVPSQRGSGDDKLHDRVGDFWYRRVFTLPAALAGRDLVLLIGAVDDFDVTWVNGVRVGATGAETPHHWESPRYYQIPATALRSGENTLLVKVTNGAYDGGIWGPVALGLPGVFRPLEAAGPPLRSHSLVRRGGASVLELLADGDGFEYRMTYTLPDRKPWFTRRMSVRNISGAPLTLSNVTLGIPPLRVGPRQSAIFPGTLPVGDNPVAGIAEGQSIGARSLDPLAVLWDSGARRGVGAWYHCEEEYSPVSVQRLGTGAAIRHTQQIVAPLKPGESVTLGTQYLWMTHSSRDAAIAGVQAVYRQIGLRPPKGALPGLAGKVLYCGHPGGTPELSYRGYGGFRALEAYVPTLKKLGIDLVWLLPIWEHGDGKRWNLYSPFDHLKVSPLYGTPEELKSCSAALSRDGMRLMFDLVPHGPPDFTPLAKEHPEWICHDPDGSLHYEWAQYAFDNALPGWQDYMRRAATLDATEYNAIGARVDCGAGGPLNYNPAAGHRPSESGLAAGLGMNRAIREGFLAKQGQVVLLPEEYTGANIFYRVSDLTYDCQLFFLLVDLQAKGASPQEWAESLQRFLHDQQISLPPGALKMRWISNHDTVSWTFQKKRPAEVYGVPKMRALETLCAFIPGVPMLYQGDEDPSVYGGKGVSNVDYLGQVYGLRKSNPALRRGAADYTSVTATGGVFACLRESGANRALVLISLNPAPIRSTVRSPESLAGRWKDALSGESITVKPGARIPFAPCQVRVLIPAL